LISASRDKRALLWSTKELFGALSARPLVHSAPVLQAALDAHAAVVTLDAQHRVLVWDRQPIQVRLDLPHNSAVTSVAMSPDGRQIATGSIDRRVRVFDAATGELLSRSRSYQAIAEVAFDGSGKLVAAGADRRVHVITAKERILEQSHKHPILAIAVSHDGRVATASEDGNAKLWDTRDNIRPIELPHSPVPGVHESSASNPSRFVLDVAWDPAGQRIATAGADRRLVIWSGRTGVMQQELTASGATAHEGAVVSVTWSPDGHLLSGSEDGTARIWDGTSLRMRATLRGHTGAVRRVAFSAHGKFAITASADATARIWNVKTGELVAILAGHASGLRDAAFTTSGRDLVAVTAGDDGTLRIWDASTGALRALYNAHSGRIERIALTPDGTRVVTAGADGYARVFPIGIDHVKRIVLEHCSLAALFVGRCPLVSADAPPSPPATTPPPLASCDESEADSASLLPAADDWPSSYRVRSDVTAPLLRRTTHPELELRLRRDGRFYHLVIEYKGRECSFRGCMKGGAIVLDPGQKCSLQIETPDFCTLSADRCDSPLGNLVCATKPGEAAGHATATLLSGTVTRIGSELGLTLGAEVDACVLARGYESAGPFKATRDFVHLATRNRCR
jgi:WD40 repeat protein